MIELVAGSVDTSAAARIRTKVWRWIVSEAEAIEHARATTPMFHDWLALLDGEPVGVGSCSLNPEWRRTQQLSESLSSFPRPEAKALGQPSIGRFQRMHAGSANPS
jgi:hypothetical protein